MTTNKLNPNTPNNEVGLCITRSRRVKLDIPFGELAVWLKAGTAGDVVWYNDETKETGIWNLEAGEMTPLACTVILTSATIEGVLESTTATNMLWATAAQQLGRATGF